MIERDVIANFSGFANHDAHAVVDKKPTNGCARVISTPEKNARPDSIRASTGQPLDKFDDSIGESKSRAYRVTGQHLKGGLNSRVAGKDRTMSSRSVFSMTLV